MAHINGKGNTVLLSLTLITFAAYAVIFAAAFADLPMSIPPWHQLLLLYFHFIPMFLLELLLCRTAKLTRRILLPAVLLAVPGLWFVASAEWYAMAWFLAGWWCVSPVLGCLAAWAVWALSRRLKRSERI